MSCVVQSVGSSIFCIRFPKLHCKQSAGHSCTGDWNFLETCAATKSQLVFFRSRPQQKMRNESKKLKRPLKRNMFFSVFSSKHAGLLLQTSIDRCLLTILDIVFYLSHDGSARKWEQRLKPLGVGAFQRWKRVMEGRSMARPRMRPEASGPPVHDDAGMDACT